MLAAQVRQPAARPKVPELLGLDLVPVVRRKSRAAALQLDYVPLPDLFLCGSQDIWLLRTQTPSDPSARLAGACICNQTRALKTPASNAYCGSPV